MVLQLRHLPYSHSKSFGGALMTEIVCWLANLGNLSIKKKCYAENPVALHCWEFWVVSQRGCDLRPRLKRTQQLLFGVGILVLELFDVQILPGKIPQRET